MQIEKLSQLPVSHQTAFAYMMCKGHIIYYSNFAISNNFGNLDVMQVALDAVGSSICDSKLSNGLVSEHFNKVKYNTPDTDDYDSIEAADALDFCCMLLNALQFISDKNISHISYIYNYGIDIVDRHIIDVLDVDVIDSTVEAIIKEHPLMVAQILAQNKMVDLLSDYASAGRDINDLLSVVWW